MQIQYNFLLHLGSKIKNKTTKVHFQSQPPFFITTDLRTRRNNPKKAASQGNADAGEFQ